MSTINQLHNRVIGSGRRVIFPEAHDPRVIQAATTFKEKGLGVPVLTGADPHASASQIEWVDATGDLLNKAARQLVENRKHKGMTLTLAEEAIESDPLLFSALLVKTGFVDASVAGSVATTASVIRAGLYGVGAKPGRKLVSSFFLMQLQDRAVTYADCGVVPDPTAEQLAEIAITSAENHEALTGETPKVAMLSFSTLGSAQHPKTEKVRTATELVRQSNPTLLVDGEMQFDTAFEPSVAKRKAPNSAVAGQANVFVFPDLDSGNIAYKITERLAGATALGPLVQGLERPCMDLSRGCSASDIVDVAVIASVLSGNSATDSDS